MNARAAIALFSLNLSACISDLAVGTSIVELDSNEAGAPAQVEDSGVRDSGMDASMAPTLDAAVQDASVQDAAVHDATVRDASAKDAALDATVVEDAAVDAGRDAGHWLPCIENDCYLSFIGIKDMCGDAALQHCGRPSPADACQWYCE